jgi:hypothetical protein
MLVIGGHYLLWGRWLTRILEEQARREQDSNAPTE